MRLKRKGADEAPYFFQTGKLAEARPPPFTGLLQPSRRAIEEKRQAGQSTPRMKAAQQSLS